MFIYNRHAKVNMVALISKTYHPKNKPRLLKSNFTNKLHLREIMNLFHYNTRYKIKTSVRRCK